MIVILGAIIEINQNCTNSILLDRFMLHLECQKRIFSSISCMYTNSSSFWNYCFLEMRLWHKTSNSELKVVSRVASGNFHILQRAVLWWFKRCVFISWNLASFQPQLLTYLPVRTCYQVFPDTCQITSQLSSLRSCWIDLCEMTAWHSVFMVFNVTLYSSMGEKIFYRKQQLFLTRYFSP